jgi:predicted nucleic acid-binding protein
VKLVVDTYAWVELFLGREKGQRVISLLKEAEEVRTPDIVLAEIARKYDRENVEAGKVKSRLQAINEASLVTPIDSDVALKCERAFVDLQGKARKERLGEPSLFDAIVLATARVYSSMVLTGDQHFAELPETLLL